MKCYDHENETACGVCALCNRGVCKKSGCGHFDESLLFCKDHDGNDVRNYKMKELKLLLELERESKNG